MKLVLNCAQCKLRSENVIKITNFKDMGDIYVALRLKSLQQKLYGHHHDLVDRCKITTSQMIFSFLRRFLAHLAFRPCELLSSLFVRRLSSVVRPSTFHILIFSSETTGPIATKLWWNSPWMAPFQNCVRWSRLPTKMATKLKIEKRGDEILIVHCCFSIIQNELKF